jgi:uncharacterized membrane protein YfcA
MDILPTYLLLAGAAFIAGVMNAVAGGGTFVTFPTLVFTGVPSVVANASNTVALSPAFFSSAWAYRHDFQNIDKVSLKAMTAVSLVGGVIGAVLLLQTSESTFDAVVPWLLLAATLIFAFGPRITPRLQQMFTIGPVALLSLQFLVGIYGGYFGGAAGIIMLAIYSLYGLTNLNAMNATKTLQAGLINGIAVVIFAVGGKVVWPQTLVMLVTATLGGYYGARVARTMNPKVLRAGVIIISVVVTAAFFVRHFG